MLKFEEILQCLSAIGMT